MPKTSADVPNQSGTPPTVWPVDSQADFRTDRRMLLLSALAVPIGVIGAMVAKALPWSIAFFTDLSFFHRFSTQTLPPENHHLGWWLLLAPATGALIVGLMRVMARPRSVDNRMTGSLPKRIERLQKLRTCTPKLPPNASGKKIADARDTSKPTLLSDSTMNYSMIW